MTFSFHSVGGEADRFGNLSLTLMGMGRKEVWRKEKEGEPHGSNLLGAMWVCQSGGRKRKIDFLSHPSLCYLR